MTTTLDLVLFPLRGGACRRELHFSIDGFFAAADALDELAPGACYDQLGRPQPVSDRTIREVVLDSMPAGWACIPFALATDGGGHPHPSCAELFRAPDGVSTDRAELMARADRAALMAAAG